MSVVYKKFTKDVGLMALVHGLTVAKGFIFLPLITKMLGAFSYGIWTQLLITATLVAPLVRLGLTNSLVRHLASEKDEENIQEGLYSTLFSVVAMAILFLALFLLFLAPISKFFQAPILLTALLPFIVLFECLNAVLMSAFQAWQKMVRYSLFTMLASGGEIILVALSVYLGYGLWGAVLSLIAIRMLVFILIFLNIYASFGFRFPTFNLLKGYLAFGLPTVLSNTAYWVVTSADKYILGFFLGTLAVGYYAPAYALGNLLAFFIVPIGFVLFPAVSKAYDENKINEVKNKLQYSLKYFLLLAIPAVFGIVALMKEVLKIFTTEEIAQNAFFVVPFVAVSILIYGATDIFSQTLTLLKKTNIVGLVWAAAAILNIILNVVLVPRLGILGAAIATLAAYIFGFLLIWHYSFKELPFEIDYQSIAKILLSSALMGFVVWKINPSGLFMTIITICIGAVIYGALILILRVFTQKEFSFVKDLIGPSG